MKNRNPEHARLRRSFLKGSLATGAAIAGATVLGERKVFAQTSESLTKGDVAILRLLAAAELIEADLWQQYAELGGVTQGTQNQYQLALQNLDGDGSQYLSSNTLDEFSHADFLNAYLESKGQEPVDFDRFRTLPSSTAAGAQQIGRLTNLMQLTVDTSWYTRYRSANQSGFRRHVPSSPPGFVCRPVYRNSQNQCRVERQCSSRPSDRQHGGVSLWLYRASWFEPLRDTQSAGVEPRSPKDHAQYRWRRDMPLSRMGRFFG